MYVADFYMGNFPMWQHRLNCRENASAFMYSIRLDIFSQKKKIRHFNLRPLWILVIMGGNEVGKKKKNLLLKH